MTIARMVHAPHCMKPDYVVQLCKCGANVACRCCRWGSGQIPCGCYQRRGDRLVASTGETVVVRDATKSAPAAHERSGAGHDVAHLGVGQEPETTDAPPANVPQEEA